MFAKRVLSTIIAGLFLATALLAQPPVPTPAPKGTPPVMPGPRMYAALNLTDQQRAQIDDLHLALQKKMIALRADLQKLNAEYKLMLIDPKVSEKGLKAQLQKIADVRLQMALERAKNVRKIRSLLNAEQQKKFDAFVLSRKSGRRPHGHKKMMPARPGQRMYRMPPKGF